MRFLISSAILISSIVATYKMTFDMTQEVVGALFIEGFVVDHGVHTKLINALEENDIEKAKKIATALRNYNEEIVETMVSSLEKGSYTYFTKSELEKGREFLDSIKESSNDEKALTNE